MNAKYPLWLALACLPACALIPVEPVEPPRNVEGDLARPGVTFADMWASAGGRQEAPPPDPGVVSAQDPGIVAPVAAVQRGVQSGEAGRTTILELYQKVLEERDALTQRVSALEADRAKLRQHLRDADGEIEVLAQRIIELEAVRDEQQLQNEDLAGRLLTAQIRRLEAEKVLFETKLEILRAQEQVVAEDAAETQSP